jgi:hypothetical protein
VSLNVTTAEKERERERERCNKLVRYTHNHPSANIQRRGERNDLHHSPSHNTEPPVIKEKDLLHHRRREERERERESLGEKQAEMK